MLTTWTPLRFLSKFLPYACPADSAHSTVQSNTVIVGVAAADRPSNRMYCSYRRESRGEFGKAFDDGDITSGNNSIHIASGQPHGITLGA